MQLLALSASIPRLVNAKFWCSLAPVDRYFSAVRCGYIGINMGSVARVDGKRCSKPLYRESADVRRWTNDCDTRYRRTAPDE